MCVCVLWRRWACTASWPQTTWSTRTTTTTRTTTQWSSTSTMTSRWKRLCGSGCTRQASSSSTCASDASSLEMTSSLLHFTGPGNGTEVGTTTHHWVNWEKLMWMLRSRLGLIKHLFLPTVASLTCKSPKSTITSEASQLVCDSDETGVHHESDALCWRRIRLHSLQLKISRQL